jgi:hypothetical protein
VEQELLILPQHLSQPVFALTPDCGLLSGEAANTNFIVFGLTATMAQTQDLQHPRRAS